MKVIFLDIDGVLNSHEWDMACAVSGGDLLQPAPKMVVRLLGAMQDVCAITGEMPKIVLSSSWRSDPTMTWPFPVYDKTPRGDAFGNRADEIRAWLDQRLEDMTGCRADSFAILDDEPDAGLGMEDHFIQTDHRLGLTAADAAKLVGLFT